MRTPGSLLGISLIFLVLDGTPSLAAWPASLPVPARSAVVVEDSLFDANELRMSVSNTGGVARYFPDGTSGLEWPKGTGRSVIYSAGLWIGAEVNGAPRVTVASYGWEYAAGPLDAAGQPVDPTEVDPAHHVYKIRRGDDASNPDWAQWPSALGAPHDGAGNPRVLGDQTLWCVYNDAVASKHNVRGGMSAPLGLEVRQTVFGFDRPGPIGRMAFVEYQIFNRGPNTLSNAYVGLWCDPDLGVAQNDLVGCDTTLGLGYCYNATPDDFIYGGHPPAVGIQLLKGPATLGGDLRMSAFGRLIKGFLEPASALEAYGRFQGVREDGQPQTCDGLPTAFEVNGDPVAPPNGPYGSHCVDESAADRRFMLSTGPFDFPSGTSKRVVIAVIVGGRDGIGDRLGNLERLRSYARVARELYDRNFVNIGTAAEVDPGGSYLATAGEPVVFDGTGSVAGTGPAPVYLWDFGDGSLPAAGLQPSHTYAFGGVYRATLVAQTFSGIPVSCGARVEVYQASSVTATFTNATERGVVGVESIRPLPEDPPLFEGVDWGGRYFGGGLDTGCRWSGSAIVDATIDVGPLCYGATYAPQRFKSVLLVYGTAQKAYRYFRRELANGGEPAAGPGYTYQGYVDIPFRVFAYDGDSLGPQLQLMFTERQVTDDLGDPTGQTQPASQDGVWFPTSEADGGHEYINILDLSYSETPDPTLTVDGRFFGVIAPVLYGGRMKRSASAVVRDGAGIRLRWVDSGDPGPGLDVAWGSIGRGGPGYFTSNGDGTSRLFWGWTPGGRFNDYEVALPRALIANARSAAWGDFDGDGRTDLFVAGGVAGSHLLHNELPELALVPTPALSTVGSTVHAAWADYDLDGDLDLYLINAAQPSQLFRNDGAAGFTDATPVSIAGGGAVRATWVDYDGDLDPDLCVSNGVAATHLYRNDRAAGFTEMTPSPFYGFGYHLDNVWGDYDGDGDPDVFLVRDLAGDVLLRNDGPAGFADATPTTVMPTDTRGRRAAWADFDLDGDLDLAVAHAGSGFHLIRNEGQGAFVDATYIPFQAPANVNAFALADYDTDGDLDVLMTSTGADFLARNELHLGRWIHVRLEGTRSQRQGIGARIRVVAGGVAQTRYVTAADPPPLTALFGVGGAGIVDSIEVDWPSGAISRMTAVPVFSRVGIQENYVPPRRVSFARVSPNPSQGRTRVDLLVPPGTSALDLTVHDLSGRAVWSRRLTGLNPGLNTFTWDGTNGGGRSLPAGIYFLRARGASSASARIVLIR